MSGKASRGGSLTAALVMAAVLILLPEVQPARARLPPTLLPGRQRGNCSYTVEIQTTCATSAETTDHISLRFGDSAGNHVIAKHLKHPKRHHDGEADESEKLAGNKKMKAFKRCGVDRFKVKGPCMEATVCYLYLKRIGSDDWRPGYAKVHHTDERGLLTPLSHKFYFRTFLPEHVWFGFDYCNVHQDKRSMQKGPRHNNQD